MLANTMPSYMIRAIPDGLIARAKQRARHDATTLDAILIRYLETYSEHGSPQAAGGRALQAGRTRAERRASAQHAARARWQSPDGAE